MARIYQDDHNVLVGQGPQATLYQYDINVLVSDISTVVGSIQGYEAQGTRGIQGLRGIQGRTQVQGQGPTGGT